MLATLDHIDQLAPNIKMFWFRPAQKVSYKAGQFTELYLPHANKDNRGDKRWFTLTSSPTEDLLAITTRFAPEKGSSFKATLAGLEVGTQLDLASPMGDFVLPKKASQELVFVAGGIGITPMRSMVKYLSDTGDKRKITFIHAVTVPSDLVFQDLMVAYGVDYQPVVKEPGEGWEGRSGTIDAQAIKDIAGNLDGKLVYLSGPEPMIEALEKGLQGLGVAKKQLMSDFFPGYVGV